MRRPCAPQARPAQPRWSNDESNALARYLSLIALAGLLAAPAAAQPIKLGELNSYKTFPAFLDPYRKGMELAVDEVNRAGGLLGRKVELVVRDDNGTPGDAVRVAEELVSREKVDVLMGTFSSAVGLAVADFAKQRKVLFIASEPLTDKIVWENGNRYTFRLRPSTYMQTAMLVPYAAKLGKRRWAIVYPDYEYGKSATAAFKQQMIALQPAGIEFVEFAVPLGKIDAGPVVQAMADAKPDAIFSSLFAADLAKFVREGELRGALQGSAGVQSAGRRTRIPRPAQGRSACRVVCHGLSVVGDRDARAQALPRRVPGEVQGLSAPGFGRRLQRGDDRGGGDPQGALDRQRETRGGDGRTRRSTRRSDRSRSARSITSRRWARTSAASRSRTARA